MKLGVPVTIVAVMMKSNYPRLAEIAGVAKGSRPHSDQRVPVGAI